MVTFLPFPGFRPSLKDGEGIENRISPPYDVIGDDYLKELQSRPGNVTLLTLKPDEDKRYRESRKTLDSWIADGTLVQDDDSFYLYKQTFDDHGVTKTRTGFVGRLKTEKYEEGNIIPHEETFSKVKADRLNLLRDMETHLESIFGIFKGFSSGLIADINRTAVKLYEMTDDSGVKHEYFRIGDKDVIAWWEAKIKEVYDRLPLLGGFLVKADSEGRPGPFTYGRTQADGANMLGDVIKPYGGIIIWRCFVYNCTQDWRDTKTDRARAGYDYFKDLDGAYHDNVILQIKNGPMDFQIREPVSPLIGGLQHTNQILEVQVAQEYTGHQIDLCYLIPLFKEVLDFHTHCCEGKDTVADVVSGRTMGNNLGGMAAVINTGNDLNWTGDDLAAANTYGFGRLSFNTDLSAEEIAREWIALTFKLPKKEEDVLCSMLLRSREIYEKYTSPLGIGWMVTPNDHYGPSVDGYEYSRWGTYHRADHLGIGVDRTDKGTGYAQQYYPENAKMYNDPDSCPEELLLFFHHIPYTRMLKTGKTLIQHIYDSHFEGEEEARGLASDWDSLKDVVPAVVFDRVKERFDLQLANAREWRDQVNSYFYRKSGIADEKGRTIY